MASSVLAVPGGGNEVILEVHPFHIRCREVVACGFHAHGEVGTVQVFGLLFAGH
jgi:hypothetical protein